MTARERLALKMVSRTFWLTVVLAVAATTLLWNGKITDVVWGNVVEWILTTYAVKSVAEKSVWTKNEGGSLT